MLYGLAMFVLGAISQYIGPGFSWIYSKIGEQGTVLALIVLVPLLVSTILSTKYIVDIVGTKLDNIMNILIRMAEHMGVEVRRKVQSPGYVYMMCRWLRISREEVDETGVHHIYVYCAHPQSPMTEEGCPPGCS